jgi:prepilin-type N-terminal cleavage/methylation domain-containing protein
MTKKGFTLIELLVVIAIIGILASIVLVSLSGARGRARDARITSDLGQLRTVATIFNDENGTYTGLDADSEEDTLAADIAAQGGTYTILIDSDGGGYCAASSLNGGGYWCVDSGLKSERDVDGTLTSCVATCEAADSCACD